MPYLNASLKKLCPKLISVGNSEVFAAEVHWEFPVHFQAWDGPPEHLLHHAEKQEQAIRK